MEDIITFSKKNFPNSQLTFIKNVIDKPICPHHTLYHVIVDTDDNIIEFCSNYQKSHIIPCFQEIYIALEFAQYKNLTKANLYTMEIEMLIGILQDKNNKYALLVINIPNDNIS